MESSTYYHKVISNGMTSSHKQPFYLSCATTPLGKKFILFLSIDLKATTTPVQQSLE